MDDDTQKRIECARSLQENKELATKADKLEQQVRIAKAEEELEEIKRRKETQEKRDKHFGR